MLEAVLIAGPTASGKSALAISLAQRTGGIVVNADSMQVYRDLRILTARPSGEEERAVPHMLFGHVDASVNYSVGHWLADVRKSLNEARDSSRLPIITGGTGLYFKAILHGLSDIPKVPDVVRAQVRSAAEGMETPVLHAQLALRDPEGAGRLKPNDRQRILRALEVIEATRQPLAAFQSRRGAPLLDASKCRTVFLAPERAELYRRIDRRFDVMVEAGALEEVRALAARHLDPALPAMRAHGVPGFLRYLAGEISLEEAILKGKLDTRHYAKRQFTWFRHQLTEFEWFAPEAALASLLQSPDRAPA